MSAIWCNATIINELDWCEVFPTQGNRAIAAIREASPTVQSSKSLRCSDVLELVNFLLAERNVMKMQVRRISQLVLKREYDYVDTVGLGLETNPKVCVHFGFH